MLPNKFDQYFRDKLLDHSTKVSQSSWKLIHAGLLRHKAFHFWKWYVAGPSAVVVAITGHFMLAQINKPVNARIGHSVHTLTQSVAPLSQTVAANDSPQSGATPATAGTAPITSTPPTSSANPITNGANPIISTPATPGATPIGKPDATAATNPVVRKLHTTPNANARLTLASTDTRSQAEAKARHPTNGHLALGNHRQQAPGPPSETGPLASDASSTKDPGGTKDPGAAKDPGATKDQASVHSPHAPITQPTIARPATRLAVTAQTPNPRSPKNLTLPATPYQPTGRWRIDGFASPEYFSFKEFGFSYGAGARATMVLKQHFTITAGIQYLKVDVRARQKDDSLNSLYPGIFNNIQLPLLFGYTTGNNRFSVSVNAGAIFSLYADAKGRLKDYGWPNHNGVTSYLGFNFATRVGNRLSLFAEPYIKCWYPQSTQDLPPQLFSTGISVGVRFDLK
jgi:hypothetical protein